MAAVRCYGMLSRPVKSSSVGALCIVSMVNIGSFPPGHRKLHPKFKHRGLRTKVDMTPSVRSEKYPWRNVLNLEWSVLNLSSYVWFASAVCVFKRHVCCFTLNAVLPCAFCGDWWMFLSIDPIAFIKARITTIYKLFICLNHVKSYVSKSKFTWTLILEVIRGNITSVWPASFAVSI